MTEDALALMTGLRKLTRVALFSSTTQCIQKSWEVVGVEIDIQMLLILVQGTNEKTPKLNENSIQEVVHFPPKN